MNEEPTKKVRVRMPPSPTGYFHIGSARTMLFNWIFARQNNGTVVFRSEDTDKERSKKEFELDILQNLKALGWGGDDYDWYEGLLVNGEQKGDYGPYRQSERTLQKIYTPYLQKLIDEKLAWYCYCTKEELEKLKVQGRAFFDPCFETKEVKDEKSVIRFRIPKQEIVFTDIVRGDISFDGALCGDIVIARNLEDPLYNFAVVVDDELMKITHVIRGDDQINNTQKQVSLIEALGFTRPAYAHIPLILNPDKSKMSKRSVPEGASAIVNDYWKQGYHPSALTNFLALLGWHPKDDQEILSEEELFEKFDLSRVQKGGAVFDVQKLYSVATVYMRNASSEELLELHKNYPNNETFIPTHWQEDEPKLLRSLSIIKERMKSFTEFVEGASFLYEEPSYEPELLIWQKGTKEDAVKHLTKVGELLKGADFSSIEELEKTVMPYAEEEGKGDVLWPLRAALSGKDKSPSPIEILWILGAEESQNRMDKGIAALS